MFFNIVYFSLNRTGSLVAVVGLVGSGKSSLLAAVLGEMKSNNNNNSKGGGEMRSTTVHGTIALVAQKAWIQNATVREAILFGDAFDQIKYDRVLSASQLLQDLASLSNGDQTEIGDRGLNLSGELFSFLSSFSFYVVRLFLNTSSTF